MPAEVQGVPVLLPRRVVLLQHEVHELPLHAALLRNDQVSTKLDTHDAAQHMAFTDGIRCNMTAQGSRGQDTPT